MPPPRVDTEAVDPAAEKERNDIQTLGGRPSSSNSSVTATDRYEEIHPQHKEGGDPDRRGSSGSRRGSFRVRQPSVSAQLRNPLAGKTEADVLRDVDLFVDEKGLDEFRDEFQKGALLARVINREGGYEHVTQISLEERDVLRYEQSHRWKQPFMLYFLVVLCAGSAIVQGMDQTAVNGAQVFYFEEFGITNEWQQGLLNGAPYLFSAAIGCWTNAPLNKLFGRRGTIFISCLISFASSFWMAAANSWINLLIARFILGFAVGAKSSTTPVYAAECAPKTIRGALTMMWQMWTAFGIMLGFVASVAFQNVDFLGEYSQWRWMLASTAIPPFFVCIQVYFCPESPRWYMEKGKFDKAFKAFARLRTTKVQAARDMYYAYKMLEIESAQREGKNLWKEFFFVKRNRRAAQSSFFVMFMQQFCGVNVIAYYSTQIFMDSGFSRSNALLVSFGTGVTNWLFAIPAIYTIDTFGRRNLLLTTFPLMGMCLLWTGFSFWAPDGDLRLGLVASGIYMFMVIYSPGEGPVPFTYSAEAFPLYIRDVGMSFATATCWGFNFILSLTWPALVRAFRPQGAFAFYACWNFFAFFFAYLFLPETKNLTLEELDDVFSVGAREHAKYYMEKAPWYLNKHILRRDVEPVAPLYQFNG
ncbi:uncharacterized protein A1O9_02426 [Exophiala aquamarina CBS 119918]|uniref:Major facilitator superfamily (MFS) profile domain-containing protein n=1 Tax=Exophiala aquamarina CBS 119918 TaxID=1182545 RepID=A0A072PLA6_9EURO|nr:uncharacterized protein A1O9_02426 [Exophiala aquamarina CBS 119918]KEF60864.1 hypothetical protein A1O9_02426 [Exophiala aquamarina CBS 119918]